MAFTQENTTGYTDAELDALNAEWAAIVDAEGLESDTDEYYAREKQFQDEVAGRTPTSNWSQLMNTKQISEALVARYGISGKGSMQKQINHAIRTLPGGTETLVAITAINSAINHAERAGVADRVIANTAALERVEAIRTAMERHVMDSIGAE